MAALSNGRHELFAQGVAKGETVECAAASAGLSLQPFASHDGAYVYLLVDPRSGKAFYVGKGTGSRALIHEKAARAGKERNGLKARVLGDLRRAGLAPQVWIVEDGLTSDQAYRLERRLIVKAHGQLTNIALGQRSLAERVRSETLESMAQMKPLCRMIREGSSPERLKLWARIVTEFGSIAANPQLSH